MNIPTDIHEEVPHARALVQYLSGASDKNNATESAIAYYGRNYASLMVLSSKIEGIVLRDGDGSTLSNGLSQLALPLQMLIQSRIANATESVNIFKGNALT